MKPKFEDAPGLIIRPADKQGTRWEARWQCRTDIAAGGFEPKSQRVWIGTEPTDTERAAVSDDCRRLQDEMLLFHRGGIPQSERYKFDGTIKSLVDCFQTDAESSYHKMRYSSRLNHDAMLKRIVSRHGDIEIADITARVLLGWHRGWTYGASFVGFDDPPKTLGPHLATGHLFVSQLRTLFGFGADLLLDKECERLCAVMHRQRFKQSGARTEILTAKQATAIRMYARYVGNYSIAVAQAFQYECTLRQKDVIGEIIPLNEPGVSDTIIGNMKWVRGLRWEEIDEHFILRHITSKREKPLTCNLRLALMVCEELAREYPGSISLDGATYDRSLLPASGPIILSEYNALPYKASEFRRKWRQVADGAGIPKTTFNMDSRAGAITEATDAGAELEDVRHAATHSDINMTMRYSRGAEKKVAKVMQLRRGGRGTEGET